MDTNDLVRSLAADHGWRTPSVRTALAVALLLAFPIALTLLVTQIGVRPDFADALGHGFFVLKFAVTLALSLAALLLAVRLSQPAAPLRPAILLFAIPAGLLAAGIVTDLSTAQTAPWTVRLIGSNALVCLVAVPLLSVPLLAAALFGLRNGASTRPAVTGAAAGLVAGAIAAALYAAHCIDDSPLFVATWYTMAMALVAGVGALAGRWLLRI